MGRVKSQFKMLPLNLGGSKACTLITPRPTIPEVNRLDHQIALHNGSTSILELSRERVRLTKMSSSASLSTRIEQLTRELGHQRQEIQFYRQCFEILQKLREDSYGAYQELFLALHLGEADGMEGPLDRLHKALETSVRAEAGAKRAWLGYWGIDEEADDDFI